MLQESLARSTRPPGLPLGKEDITHIIQCRLAGFPGTRITDRHRSPVTKDQLRETGVDASERLDAVITDPIRVSARISEVCET